MDNLQLCLDILIDIFKSKCEDEYCETEHIHMLYWLQSLELNNLEDDDKLELIAHFQFMIENFTKAIGELNGL